MVVYDSVVTKGTENVDHGIRGYYFGENGEHSWYDISKAIGKAMVELGLSDTDEPETFTTEQLGRYFPSEVCTLSRSWSTGVVNLMTIMTGIRSWLRYELAVQGDALSFARMEAEVYDSRHAGEHQARD